MTSPWIVQIAHINLTVPQGTLHLADDFYAGTLGLTKVPVPQLQRDTLAWYNLPQDPNSSFPPQQIHIAFPRDAAELALADARRHPCFKLASPDALQALQTRIFEHHLRGGDSAPKEADKPGEMNSGGEQIEQRAGSTPC